MKGAASRYSGTWLPTYARVSIYLRCASCSGKRLKDPAKYAPKLAEHGVRSDTEKVKAGAEKPKKDDMAYTSIRNRR